MREKLLKTILISILILILTITDFVVLGQSVVIALTNEIEMQGFATNISNVEFNAYFKNEDEKVYSKQSLVTQGDSLFLGIMVKEAGVLENAKIKIENSNFRLQETQNQYIKSVNVDANEIELNQIITGDLAEINIPIKFEKIGEINKDYLSQESKVILTGNYKNDKDVSKKVLGERNVTISWNDEVDVLVEQSIDKYIHLEGDKTLFQQLISSQIQNNTLVQGKEIEVVVPEIQGLLPETVDVLINGKQAEQEKYFYNKESKIVTINNLDTNNQEKDEYKVIYHYLKAIEGENLLIGLNSKMKVSLYTDEVVEKNDVREVEAKQADNRVSVSVDSTDSVFKGYFYANSTRDTNYKETVNTEISTLEGIGSIEFKQMQDYFVEENGIKNSANGKSFIRNIKFVKSNLENILGEDFVVSVLVDNNQVLGEINKDSEWNEDGEIVVAVEEKVLDTVRIICNQPVKIGTLSIQVERYIKGETGYDKAKLKTFSSIENTKVIKVGEKEIPFSSSVVLKDTSTEARLEISNTNFSVLNKNENVQILTVLKSDNEKYDLYKNPYLEIKLPDELQSIDVHSVNILYGDGLSVTKSVYQPDTKTIQIQLEGEQVDFRTEVEEGIQIVINADLTFKMNVPNTESAITLLFKNENASEPQYEASVGVALNSRYGAILYNNVSGFNGENTVLESADSEVLQAQLDVAGEQRQANVSQSFINNYDVPINQITVVGSLAEDSSNFDAGLVQNVVTDSESAQVYYSSKENAIAEDDSWHETMENLQEVKSYKIVLNKELQPFETMNMNYKLNIPSQLEAGAEITNTTNVSYSFNGQLLDVSSGIQLYTDGMNVTNGLTKEEDGIKTEIIAMSANKQLNDGEEIFEGQPVKYTVNVTNNTGKDLNNFGFVAEHSNVVYYVQEKTKAEITDNPDNPETVIFTKKDENAKNITEILEVFKNGETATFVYEFVPKKRDGIDITGNIKLKADNLEEKTVSTISNKIKDAKISVEVLNDLDENYQVYEGNIVPFKFYITNYTDEDQKDILLNIQISDELICLYENDYIERELTELFGAQVEVVKNEKNLIILKIPVVKAKEVKRFNIIFQCGELPNKEEIYNATINYTAQLEDTTYFSNTLVRSMKRVSARVTATQDVDVKEKRVKIGDRIIYTAEITNEDSILNADEMILYHEVTEGNAKIEKAYLKKENGETIEATIDYTNQAKVEYNLKAGEKIQYIAEILLWDNPNEDVNYEEIMSSYIALSWKLNGSLVLDEIEYEIEEEYEEDDNYDYLISGIAWEDENKNGERDSNESTISDLEVKLIDSNTGNVIKNAKTDEIGMYQFDDLEKGNYIVMFEYDSLLYSVTQYKKEGVKDTRNSDIVQKEKDGRVVAMTDILTIDDYDISSIDAGFIRNMKFDLSLDKSINKVVVSNQDGTDENIFNKAKLAKVEINGRHIDGSIVVVEYEIEVKNEGEVEGYVKEVIDYMPKDLEFSSEINKDWYIGADGNLHNMSLSNKAIKPGESKVLNLILTKQMTAQNTGRSVNIAEIASATNELSIADSDSIPGNRNDNEDDISRAELIVSIKTGALVVSIVALIVVLALLVIVYVIYRKRKGGK